MLVADANFETMFIYSIFLFLVVLQMLPFFIDNLQIVPYAHFHSPLCYALITIVVPRILFTLMRLEFSFLIFLLLHPTPLRLRLTLFLEGRVVIATSWFLNLINVVLISLNYLFVMFELMHGLGAWFICLCMSIR